MKLRIRYRHETNADTELEVVGWQYARPSGELSEEHDESRTYIRRIDDYIIDFPTANIIETIEIG
jgi:hypothetical protein